MLLSNATNKFDCLLKDDERISLRSGGHDYQKLKDALLRCSQQFGYQHLLNNVVTKRVVTPAIQAVQADPNTNPPDQAVVGVPQSITYLDPIKVLEVYSDKLLDIAQKNTSLIWGNQSFTDQNPKEIFEPTAANGNLTNAGCLNTAGKKVIQQQFFPKSWRIKLWQCLPMKLVKSLNGSLIFSHGKILLELKTKKWMA